MTKDREVDDIRDSIYELGYQYGYPFGERKGPYKTQVGMDRGGWHNLDLFRYEDQRWRIEVVPTLQKAAIEVARIAFPPESGRDKNPLIVFEMSIWVYDAFQNGWAKGFAQGAEQ